MQNPTTIQDIVKQLDMLSPAKQKQVLDFTLGLAGKKPEGIPIDEFLEFVGLFPHEDLEEIKKAIEEDCSQIDESEW